MAKRTLLSESTRNMVAKERQELQKKVKGMTEEELKEFRKKFNPDDMGFCGEESV